MFRYKALLFLVLYAFLSGCNQKITQQTASVVNSPKREFRAAWVATVDNIDWPSKKGLPSEQQQQEYRTILENHRKLGINTVLVQVRDAADAFYARSQEPWSEWLTGEQGKAPEPYYDPLRFMIQETHQRGMEFHAWLNLNRGTHKVGRSVSKNHITQTKPEWFVNHGGYLIFNFGIPEVRQYLTDIAANIVKYYDVDGIHFDDYFYPSPVAGETWNDEATFKRYGSGYKNIEDWRRHNIDLLIESISIAIKKENHRTKFGISPFGVWRNIGSDPSGSKTYGGLTSYDHLYADTKKWLQKGWVDYLAPQIYFAIEFEKVPYLNAADWWAKHAYNRNIYIGHATYKIGSGGDWNDPSELSRQMRFNRTNREIKGSIFYNTSSLMKNPLGVCDTLKKFYQYPALQPTMPWKDNIPPYEPKNVKVRKIANIGAVVTWELPTPAARDGEEISAFVVYRFDSNESINLENPSKILQILKNEGILNCVDRSIQANKSYTYVVTSLDRLQNESQPSNQVELK